MSIVPGTRIGKVEFYEARTALWAGNAAEIGLEEAEVTALTSRVTAARAAFKAMEIARNAAKAATQDFYEAVTDMHSDPGMGADLIQKIKTFAQTSNNPAVYTLANIPQPAPPGVTPPPGTPYKLTVTLQPTGALELRWKCDNPPGVGGTIYEVMRGPGINGPFTYIGSTGTRSFVDETLPTGSAPVVYKITGARSTTRGVSAILTVNFGTGGGGGFIVTSITEADQAGVKMAA